MPQDLQTRLVALERSIRRWKILALSTWILLAAVLVVAIGTIHSLTVRERLRAQEAEQQAQRAQEQAERARQQSLEALEQVRKHEQAEKKARQQSMRQMYHSQILLAQQAWQHRADLRPGNRP